MKSFGDGEIGNWTSPGCMNDLPITNFQYADPNDCIVLPIELLTFDAKYDGKKVDVLWATASETDNDFFTVERSKDGLNFEKIGTVKGATNSSTTVQYLLNDPAPFNGINYYRLAQTDIDGVTRYKGTTFVDASVFGNINVVPNPVIGQAEIIFQNYLSEMPVTVKVFDAGGKIVYQTVHQTKSGYNKVFMNTDAFNKGIYVIVISTEEGNSSIMRFVKE
jgi:hypothetical protein